MTLAGKLAIGLVGLGITTYAVSEALARSRPKPPLPSPSPSPAPPSTKGRRYIGSGWTGWPHKDVFPDEDAVVQAFRRLGYAVDDSLVSTRSMQLVERFQDDHNLWAVMYADPSLELEHMEAPAQPHGTIDPDQLVGAATVNALYDALLADQYFPGGWPALVAWYRSQA